MTLLTDFERTTAQQLAWCNGKDEPTEREYVQAVKLAAKWNKRRRLMGLRGLGVTGQMCNWFFLWYCQKIN